MSPRCIQGRRNRACRARSAVCRSCTRPLRLGPRKVATATAFSLRKPLYVVAAMCRTHCGRRRLGHRRECGRCRPCGRIQRVADRLGVGDCGDDRRRAAEQTQSRASTRERAAEGVAVSQADARQRDPAVIPAASAQHGRCRGAEYLCCRSCRHRVAIGLASALCGGAARGPGIDGSCGKHDHSVRAARGEFFAYAGGRAARSWSCLGCRSTRPGQGCTVVRGTGLRRCAFLLRRRARSRMVRAWRRGRLGGVMGLLSRRRVPPVIPRARSTDRCPMRVAEHAHRLLTRTGPDRTLLSDRRLRV